MKFVSFWKIYNFDLEVTFACAGPLVSTYYKFKLHLKLDLFNFLFTLLILKFKYFCYNFHYIHIIFFLKSRCLT